MQPTVLPIARGFYRSKSLPVSAQDCMNLFPHVVEQDGLNQEVLFPTPGVAQLATAGSDSADANRGGIDMAGVPYFVEGESFYRMNSDNTLDNLGPVYGNGRVSMATNGTQIVMIAQDENAYPAARGYLYSIADGAADAVEEINDEDFWANGNPQHVIHIDGYFICNTDMKTFIGSSLNDGAGWSGLDFQGADADPDPITAPAKLNNILYMIGSKSIEGFRNQPAGADFPFVRNGTFADKGTTSPWSVVSFNSAIYFVGEGDRETPAVYQYTGSGVPQKISHEGIDTILGELTQSQLAAVFSLCYAIDGHFFVEFVLPNRSIVYEIASQRWHERISRVTFQDGEKVWTRNRVNCVVKAYGKLLVGDFVDGRIGEMSSDYNTEYGDVIKRRFATKPFQNYMMSFSVPVLELTMESGTGNAEDTDPQITLTRSLDGKTWSYHRARSIGKEGEYQIRQIWRKLGRAKRFEVFAFETTAKAKVVIIQLTAQIMLHTK